MAFDDKPLADISENDIRNLIQTGRVEGPTLEYKSDLYDNSDRGSREFLLDVCMFANASGGTILIGIPEFRNEADEPTGAPDPHAEIGIEHANPEQQLLSYESRILEAIDERLPVQLRAVACSNGRQVIAIRIPNSLAKPHRVRYRGQVNFPSRRERQRYELDVREIKDLAMRTASQSERAESELKRALDDCFFPDHASPVIIVALLPVFFSNFMVDLRRAALGNALANFQIFPNIRDTTTPGYSVAGLTKRGPNRTTLTIGHNGLLKLNAPLRRAEQDGPVIFYPRAIDIFAHQFLAQAPPVFEAAGLTFPTLFGISLTCKRNLIISYYEEDRIAYERKEYRFPLLPLVSIGAATDSHLRILLDHIHQGFGQAGSPSFDASGQFRDH
jgi:Schlafen, AlbA_2